MKQTKKVLDNPDLLDYIYDYLSVKPETIDLLQDDAKLRLETTILNSDKVIGYFLKDLRNHKINSYNVKRLFIERKYICVFMKDKSIHKYKFKETGTIAALHVLFYFCNHFKNLTEIFFISKLSDEELRNIVIKKLKILLKPKKYSKINITIRNENDIFSIYNGD